MTTTPRTDKQAFDWSEDCTPAETEIVLASFARELERENAEMREKLAWQPIETAPKGPKAILVWITEVKCPALVCWDKYAQPVPGWVHFHSHGQRLLRSPDLWMPCHEANTKRTDSA